MRKQHIKNLMAIFSVALMNGLAWVWSEQVTIKGVFLMMLASVTVLAIQYRKGSGVDC